MSHRQAPRSTSRLLPYVVGTLLVAVAAIVIWLLIRPEAGPFAPGPSRTTRLPSGANPFGVTVDPRWPLDQRIQIAKSLGARYLRTEEVYVLSWDENPVCESCQAAMDAGLEITWTVRNTTRPSTLRPPDASTPVEDVGEYQRVIREVLDEYRIALVVVENEATFREHFTGTPRDYETMLRAACEVAHEKDIPCATDGMLSNTVKRYVYYYLACIAADPGRAEAFRQNVGDLPPGLGCQAAAAGPPIDDWIEAYRNAQPDFVNIHWYSEAGDDPAQDAAVFAEAVRAFEEMTGLPVITNETGQRDDDPEITTARMEVVLDYGMPFCIWYSTEGRASVLADRDGRLRPNGEAFKAFIEERI
jgi:hypothetical protein